MHKCARAQQNMCVHVYALCVCVSEQIFTKKIWKSAAI